MINNGFLFDSSELIMNTTRLMQTRFKNWRMNIKPIKTEVDYKDALKPLEVIFDAAIGTLESDEADILGLMIDEY